MPKCILFLLIQKQYHVEIYYVGSNSLLFVAIRDFIYVKYVYLYSTRIMIFFGTKNML